MTNDTTPAPIGADALSPQFVACFSGYHNCTQDTAEYAWRANMVEAVFWRAALASAAQPTDAVAYGLEAWVDGAWHLQWPLRPTEADAEQDRAMYAADAKLRLVRLSAAAPKAAPVQPGAAYAELPEPAYHGGPMPYVLEEHAYALDQMLDFADATHALRASHGQAPAPGLKGHEVAALVNRLRDVALQYRDAQQLRERIAQEIRPLVAGLGAAPTTQAAPAAVAGPSETSITLDFKQATELLEMFGGEPGLVTLQPGGEMSHSGAGLYAYYSDLPEEGAEFLGAKPDDEAVPAPAAQGDALTVIDALLNHIELQTCTHEQTHRGGAIWEICDDCGFKWADDEGGKPAFEWPAAVVSARDYLAAARAAKEGGKT